MAFDIESYQLGDVYDISQVVANANSGLMKHLLLNCSNEEKFQYMTEIHTNEFNKPGRRCFKISEEKSG